MDNSNAIFVALWCSALVAVIGIFADATRRGENVPDDLDID